MAKANRSTSKLESKSISRPVQLADTLKIPKSEQPGVSVYQAVRNGLGAKITRQQAYREILEGRVRELQKQADEQGLEDKRREQERRDLALARFPGAIFKLINACAAARAVEDGETDGRYMSERSFGSFVRMSIDEAGRDLEHSLVELGLIDGEVLWFAEDWRDLHLRDKPEQGAKSE